MYRLYSFVLSLILIFPLLVTGEEISRNEKLDQLFMQLKQAKNESEGRATEIQIWELWTTPDDPEIRSLMQQVLDAKRHGDFEVAMELLHKVLNIKSDYAEAWNQRATIFFHQRDYEQALEAVAKTLEYEPRHFGALAGRGIIRMFQGRSALAIQNFKAAMKLHPYLKERTLVPPQFQNIPSEN